MAREHKWPNALPPETDPLGDYTVTVNDVPHSKKEIAPGEWRWVVNEVLLAARDARETDRRNLFWALRSRVLTEDEMKRVDQYGSSLNIDLGVSFYRLEKSRELNEALLQQARLRAALLLPKGAD